MGPSPRKKAAQTTASPAKKASLAKGATAAKSDSPTLTLSEARRILKRFAECRVLIVGDVMMDEYLTGDAERISPEAPVPVVVVSGDKRLVGGAGNVARNIRALGGQPYLVGVRGNDTAGTELMRCLEQDHIAADLLVLPHRPTTTKTRILARLQQVVRVDREDASPLDAESVELLLALVERLLPDCDAVIVSDYGKGIISPAFVQRLRGIIDRDGRGLPVLVDPKPQNVEAYHGVTLLTPNAKETSEAAGLPVKTPAQILTAGRAIMARLGCPHLLTTLGARGMAVFTSPTEVWHIPTTARHVFDVTGAGDTVIATTALGLAAKASLVHAAILANYAAGIVVGEVGAATASPAQVTEALSSLPLPKVERW